MASILFPATKHMEFSSYKAGESFGWLYYEYRPDLTAIKLLAIAEKLKVRTHLDLLSYQVGFIHGYYNARKMAGNQLPVTQEIEDKEHILMGKLLTAKQATKGFNGYLKVSQLADNEIVFCVQEIKQGTGNYGSQWELKIWVSADSSFILNMDKHDVAIVTIPFDPSKMTNKDRMFESLMNDTPVHNCIVTAIPLAAGKVFYDWSETADKECVCGHAVETEDETLGDLEDHPF